MSLKLSSVYKGCSSVAYAGQNGLDIRGGRNWDTNNVAPRVGLAFRPFNRMVIRGGYGIHYFPLPFMLNSFNQAATGTQLGYTGGFGIFRPSHTHNSPIP